MKIILALVLGSARFKVLEVEKMTQSSWNVPVDDSVLPQDHWVSAQLCGVWTPCWLQARTNNGFWVQFDPNSPFRFVESVQHS